MSNGRNRSPPADRAAAAAAAQAAGNPRARGLERAAEAMWDFIVGGPPNVARQAIEAHMRNFLSFTQEEVDQVFVDLYDEAVALGVPLDPR